MTTTVEKLIDYLIELDQDLPVYAMHGASGVSDEVGSAFEDVVKESDDGATADLPLGTRVVYIYTGN